MTTDLELAIDARLCEMTEGERVNLMKVLARAEKYPRDEDGRLSLNALRFLMWYKTGTLMSRQGIDNHHRKAMKKLRPQLEEVA